MAFLVTTIFHYLSFFYQGFLSQKLEFLSMDWFLYDNSLRHERVNNLILDFTTVI